ncbi:MAG TPA: Ig-like domain-containing protein [Pyrinomonadaceae bacterium]|nr:Ig-like domain-containing protein [Pyrinomonadaceae bacterium]
MKSFCTPLRLRQTRVFTALLVSFMLLVTPLMPLASASALSAQIQAGGYLPALAFAPQTAVVSATKTDSFPDPDGDNKAEPGDTITYDVNVSNTGASDATGVTFTDTIDPNTTLVPGSLRVSPLAFADSYNATKDVALNISAPGVLANDTGTPSPTAQPIAAGSTTQSGTVTLNADGSFNYTPPAGFEGTDTFTYTATNGLSPNDTATVTINVDAGPAVTTTSPVDGATGIAQNSNITVNFTEPVNATTGSFSVQCPTGSPQTFTLSASPAASFTLDPTADLPAGTTCTVTVFANQITDADAFDPPDQMAADHTFSFGVKPLAVDDMRSATGNVRINTSVTGYSVLANDQAPGATITSFDAASAHGGEVTVNTSTGTFTYNPPRGFTGTDSFNYTISNSGGSDVGTVVLTVSDMIWFINNASGACTSGCDGRLTHPFTSLADFEAVNGNGTVNLGAVIDPEAGDNIFIYTGGDYTGPLTLENNQRVIGQGATSSIAALALITPAPDGDPLPSTGGPNPVITTTAASTNGINLAQNDSIHGLSVVNTTGTGISGNGFGTLTVSENVVVSNTTTAGIPVNLNNGVLAATFKSISAGNNDANPDPASGIVLTNTTGSFAVSGDAGSANNGSGGTIQRTSGDGVSLTNATSVSLDQMSIQNTLGSGVGGTQVTDFTLTNSTINAAGDAGEESAIAFNANKTTANNISGTLNVTGNVLTNSFYGGLNVQAADGTLTSANVSNNTISTTTNGPGIDFVGLGTATTAFRLESATINQNNISGTRAAGIQVQVSSGPTGTLSGVAGVPGDATKLISITNNSISLPSNSTQAVALVTSSANSTARAQMNFLVQCNGKNTGGCTAPTAAGLGSSAIGTVLLIGNNGYSDMSGVIHNNAIAATHTPNLGGGNGIGGGNGAGSAGNTSTPNLTLTVTDNTITGTDGNGILLVGRGARGFAGLTIKNNNVSAPVAASLRPGIRVDAGNSNLNDDAVCLDISNNTSAGSGGSTGIGLRKQGTVATTNDFGIEGMAATASPGVEAFVDGQNPAGGGTTLLSAASGFSNCSSAPDTASLGGSPQNGFASDSAALSAQASATDGPRVWSDMSADSEVSAADELVAPFADDSSASLYGARIVRASYGRSSATRVSRKAMTNGDAVVKPAADAEEKGTVNAASNAAIAPAIFSGETVNVSIGTLPAGKTVRISFQVTVNNPFTGAQPQVSNQGTVSGDNFAAVQTDDPAAGGSADPTVTPILTPPNVSVKDASVAEPATGSAPAAFAVTLSHAYTHTVTVDYATADGGANPATSGSDYTVTSGTLTFNPGQTVQTISVPVLADADDAETNETFLVDISDATGGASITDAQAVGTITPDSTPGTVVISELRTSGPAGPDDDFVELLNNTDSPITVAASDASAGWALVMSGNGCGDTPVVVAVIPAGTVIPARGNYLVVGSAYSLGAYASGDQTLVFNIEDDRNVALFNLADLSNVSTETRLDAVGFGSNAGGNCDLLREGSTLQPAAGSTSEYSFVRKVDKGATQDTNDNASDFVVVSTTAGAVGSNATSTLGAPGPENSTGARGPVPCNVPDTAKFGRSRLDSTVALGSAPNTVRDLTPGAPSNSTFGTIDFRRRFTNNTGGAVTQLRFRVTNTTNPSTPGAADLRALSSSAVVVGGVNDAATCGGSAPCSVNVVGTTLEQPPAQANGGGVNSTLGVGTITLGSPLPSGASANLHLLFGVQQTGDYHVSLVIETATGGSIGQDVWELRGNTESGGHSEGGCNTPPVADAGDDQTVECVGGAASVTLDGTDSTDADGDTLTYEWREGATILGTDATLNTSLAFGPHTITLKVTDPSGDFGEDTVDVNIVDTTDPMITAPPNVSVNTGPGATSCGAFIDDATLGTATASDGCSASVTVTRTGVPAGNNFPVGTTIVTYTADDGHGHTKNAYQSVTVNDNTPPVISVPANINTNAPANSCSVSLDPGTATATDNCPGVTVAGARNDSQPLNAPYPVGTTTITWTATDAHGNTASGVQTVTVNDSTPPTITLTTGTINLAPPNHQYQTFSISDLVASVSDGCDASVDINDVVILKATSDEPENANGNGDGNTLNDIVIAPDCKSLQLRSERNGGGDGRVYTITVQVRDSSGNVATAVRKVFVPRSGPAVDSGTQYTVNGCTP